MLLHPHVFSGLTLVDYNTWAAEIWHILVLRSSRRYAQVSYTHECLALTTEVVFPLVGSLAVKTVCFMTF